MQLDMNRVVDVITESLREPLMLLAARIRALEEASGRGEKGERGEKGDPGDPGAPGKDGADGKGGRGITATAIDQDGDLVVTMSDGSVQTAGQVVGQRGPRGEDGHDGKDGVDGVGFDDLSVEHDGERTVTIVFTRAEEAKRFPVKLPVQLYRGVFREGVRYERGDTVTFGGSLWHCNAETTEEKPGEGSADWTLAAKRGRDGRSAAK